MRIAVLADIHGNLAALAGGSPHARYGITERCRAGWRFSFHTLRYDLVRCG
ncbi:hypothetical protein AB4Z40_14655 [Bosea sp. 2YAB26]|uniref:hypothetical protein n=1 Tax=Bosea sp. 2YAB26 TaxID=3237478 RepID=UPI003F936598